MNQEDEKMHVFRYLVLLLLVVFLFPACQHQPFDTYKVARVIDGDTIVLDNGTQIRFIGVDTLPIREGKELNRAVKRTGKDKELIKKMGREVREFTMKLCKDKQVRLEYDTKRTDRYDRTLAYVYLKDGTFVNAWLVEHGFARVSTYPPNVKYQERFIELEKKARETNLGLWGE